MLSVIIVDDEVDALSVMQTVLKRHCGGLVGRCETASNPADALRLFKTRQFDLAFLDIHLHVGAEGLDLARHLAGTDTKVVFVTAHEQYALDAFKLRAHHYLLKPVDILEVRRLVNEVVTEKEAPSPPPSFRLRVNSANGIVLISEDDIVRIEGDGSYSYIYCKDQSPILVSRNLGKLMSELKSQFFLRVHQSHSVNLRKVKGLINKQLVELCDGSTVPVARRRKEALLERL